MAKTSFTTEPAQISVDDIHSALTGHRRRAAHSESAPPKSEPLLLTANEAARLLGMSVRQFHKLRPKLPGPVVLGPRHVRWRRTDLTAWVTALNAQTDARPEPEQLRASKLRKTRCSGGAVADSGGHGAETQAQRGVWQRMCQSNSPNDPDSASLSGNTEVDQ